MGGAIVIHFVSCDRANAEGSVHQFSLCFEVQPDTLRWALLLGDALHNMRCALDHIVYALAVRQTGKGPPPGASRLTTRPPARSASAQATAGPGHTC